MHTKKDNTQKVIIPKGTVQSGQDTIIEIPKHLQTHPILVAARLDNVKSKGPVVPYRVEIVKPKICPHSVLTTTSTPPNKASTSSCCAMGHGNALPSSSKYSSEIELNETETKEMETIMKQLQQFQKARRQFLLDTDAIGGTRSIPTLAKDVFDVSWNNPKFNDAFIMDSPPSTSSPIRREIRDSILVERNKRYGSNDLALYRNRSRESSCVSLDSERGFVPIMHSTARVPSKSDASCGQQCTPKPSLEWLGRRRDKSDTRTTVRTMEETPSKASQHNYDLAASSSRKNDKDCAPCCVNHHTSKSGMTDSDFEKIKEQLREARKKLDEAVAMVSRTVAYGNLITKPDKAPAVSTSSSKAITFHDTSKCPLVSSKSPLKLCQDECSNTSLPPCVSKDELPVPRTSRRRMVNQPNSPTTTPTTYTYPRDMPVVISEQEENQRLERSKSLPATPGSALNPTGNYQSKAPKEDTTPKNITSKPICSTVCLNMDPPLCISEDYLEKRAEELQQILKLLAMNQKVSVTSPRSRQDFSYPSSEKNSTSSTTYSRTSERCSATTPDRNQEKAQREATTSISDASCTPMYPCDLPAKQPRRELEDVRNNKVETPRKIVQAPPRDVVACVPTYPCDVPSKQPRQESFSQKSKTPSEVACTPTYPCDVPSLQSRRDSPNAKAVQGQLRKLGNSPVKFEQADAEGKEEAVTKKSKTISISTQTVETTITFVRDDEDNDASDDASNAIEVEEAETRKTTKKYKRKKK